MWRDIARELRRDAGVYAAVAVYLAAGLVVAVAAGAAGAYRPLVYAPTWLGWTLPLALLGLGVLAAGCLPHERPLRRLQARLAAISTPRRIADLALFLALVVFYGVFTSIKSMLPALSPRLHDAQLAALDAAIHGQDAWRLLAWLDPLTPAIQLLYTAVWGFCLVALTLYAVLACRDFQLKRQYVWTMLLCWVLLGNILAGLGMSVGPIFYERALGDPRFHALVEDLRRYAGHLGSPIVIGDYLWRAYADRASGEGTGVSAFPSMHLSMTTVFVLFAWRLHRLLGAAFLVFGVAILASSVRLGWHYAIDGYVSIAATSVIWLAVGWLQRRNLAGAVAPPAWTPPVPVSEPAALPPGR